MRQSTLKALYDLHSWLGVTIGLLLYVVCLSGVVALFNDELGPWVRGEARTPASEVGHALDRVVDRATATAPGTGSSFLVLLPTRWQPSITLQQRAGTSRETSLTAFDPATLSVIPAAPEGPNAVLTHLHTDLLLPEPVGRYLVGGLGVVMLISIVSGVLLHRKLLAELFTLRLRRSRRVLWSDLHKSAGLWGLPFHFVIALTGTVLGFVGFALMAAALVAYEGDAGQAMAELGAAGPQPAGAAAPMHPASALLDAAVSALPGFEPEVMVAHHYGDANATVEFLGNRPGSLVYYISVSVSAATGDVVQITDWSREPAGRRIYAMVTPLHYASYGGVALKVLYAVLGAGTCLLIVSGLQVWLARPARQSAWSRRAMPVAATAVVHGVPFAAAALFWLHGPLLALAGPARYDATAVFLAALAAAGAWSWWRGPAAAGRGLLLATGGMLTTLPMVGLLPGDDRAAAWLGGPSLAAALPVLATESVAVCLGLVLLRAARRPV